MNTAADDETKRQVAFWTTLAECKRRLDESLEEYDKEWNGGWLACECPYTQETFSFGTWLSTVSFEPRTDPAETRCLVDCKQCELQYQSSEALRWFRRTYRRTKSDQALAGILALELNGYTEEEDEEDDDFDYQDGQGNPENNDQDDEDGEDDQVMQGGQNEGDANTALDAVMATGDNASPPQLTSAQIVQIMRQNVARMLSGPTTS